MAVTASRSMTALRIATAGSVDDGKSTLIGRLLLDTDNLLDDQVAALNRNLNVDGTVNLALVTDGLRDERRQGITIDVAYRYFSIGSRRCVLVDTPGHAEYTRNMVTGASHADAAIVLVDARNGVLSQTVRHLTITAMLGIPEIILAVNKMDLVDWDHEVFTAIVAESTNVLHKHAYRANLRAIPIAALGGDNVVHRSIHTPWYTGETLLDLLVDLPITSEPDVGARLAVQSVVKHGDVRLHTGRLHGGKLTVGDTIVAQPRTTEAMVTEIRVAGREVDHAIPGDAVTVVLDREIDAGRSTVLVAAAASPAPKVTTEFDAEVCWLSERPATVRSRWVLKLATASVLVKIDAIHHRLSLDTLEPEATESLILNDLGYVTLVTGEDVVADTYDIARATGSFLLIDEQTNDTAAAGMIRHVK